MDKSILITELRRDEGERLLVYDDATGMPIKPGVTVKGHPTIGVGRALDVNGITLTESAYLCGNSIDECLAQAIANFPWFPALDEVRQRVICNMIYNMGIASLLQFHDMLRYTGEQRYSLAASAMQDSAWYDQVGQRAVRLVAMMQTGGATAPAAPST